MDKVKDVLRLVTFIRQFSALVERQLLEIENDISHAVQTVMSGVSDLSERIEKNKRNAENILKKTYLNPDIETAGIVSTLQDSVDSVFESALGGGELSKINDTVINEKLASIDDKFRTELLSVEEFRNAFRELIFQMIGALSHDDVISQKLSHLLLAMKAVNTGLTRILLNFDESFNAAEVEKLLAEFNAYFKQLFSTKSEKIILDSVFSKTAA